MYPPTEHLFDDQKDHPNQHGINHRLNDGKSPLFEFDGKSATIEQIHRYKSKRAGLKLSVKDSSRKVNHLTKVV